WRRALSCFPLQLSFGLNAQVRVELHVEPHFTVTRSPVGPFSRQSNTINDEEHLVALDSIHEFHDVYIRSGKAGVDLQILNVAKLPGIGLITHGSDAYVIRVGQLSQFGNYVRVAAGQPVLQETGVLRLSLLQFLIDASQRDSCTAKLTIFFFGLLLYLSRLSCGSTQR